jgi:hypothetical protein
VAGPDRYNTADRPEITLAQTTGRIRRCRNFQCRTVADLNEAGDCPSCAALAARVVDRMAAGALPRINLRQAGARTRPVLLQRDGVTCLVCDMPIHGEHAAYPDYPQLSRDEGTELHFHHLCHEVWRREAPFVS